MANILSTVFMLISQSIIKASFIMDLSMDMENLIKVLKSILEIFIVIYMMERGN